MKTVFFDIDTQIDFLYPAGALYVPGAERIIGAVAHLNRHAASAGSPLVSTMDAHSENDVEFRNWPAHCVSGTVGQQKAPATLLAERMVVPMVDWAERIDGIPQLLLEKRALNCFTNPNLESLLMAFNADRYVLYGVVTEICVKLAAQGLLDRGHKVEIVTDAVRSLTGAAGQAALQELTARGAVLRSAAEFLNTP
jgi:nicotinamidase/pyrazinamidase